MSPEDRLRAALAAVNAGVRLQRAKLRAKLPQATEDQIDAALREWLRDERSDR